MNSAPQPKWHYLAYDLKAKKQISGNIDGPLTMQEVCTKLGEDGLYPIKIFLLRQSRNRLLEIIGHLLTTRTWRHISREALQGTLRDNGKVVDFPSS